MAEQFLADFNTPYINSIAAKRILVNEALKNIYQGEIESEGRGVTQKFTKDTAGAQIRVIRVLPLTQEARELGSGLNGENFNTIVEQPRTQQYGLDVITVIDAPVDIPAVNQDMIPIDLLAIETKNITDIVTLNVNAMTIAGKFHKSFTSTTPSVVYYNPNSSDEKALQTAFLEANGRLDDGDLDNGVAMFPTDDRVFVIKASYRVKLMSKGVLVLGGSNYAQEMLAAGVLSPGARANKLQNGFIGDLDGVPVHMASSLIWSVTEKYLGLPQGELDKVIGYVSSGMTNARGIAYAENMKMIDSPSGQGIRMQPLFRMGFESFYGKGNVWLVETTTDSYTSPLTAIDALVPNTTKVKAPGSRFTPTINIAKLSNNSASVTTTLGAGKTLLANTVEYYWMVDYLAANYLNVPNTLTGFETIKNQSYGPNSYGTINSTNAPIYFSNTFGSLDSNKVHYVWAKAIDSDGTATVTRTSFVL
jgi:hypothetical protein